MNRPVYQIFVGKNNIAANMAWKALGEEEGKKLQEKERASREAVGAKMLLFCESAWANEEHPWWGVIRFPNLQARIDHTRTLQEIGWLEMTDAFTLLGVSDSEMAEVTLPNPVYTLWIIKNNPAAAITGYAPKGLDALRWEKHDALHRDCNSQNLLVCSSSWCNEIYPAFGIGVYPDVETHMKIMDSLNDLGWPGMFESRTYLGLPVNLGGG